VGDSNGWRWPIAKVGGEQQLWLGDFLKKKKKLK